MYHHDSGNQREFYFLRDTGLIKPKPGIAFLDFGESPPWNVAAVAEPTPIGWMYVKLRRQDIPRNMLEDTRNLRVNPATLELSVHAALRCRDIPFPFSFRRLKRPLTLSQKSFPGFFLDLRVFRASNLINRAR
jgi:hypothetical protein